MKILPAVDIKDGRCVRLFQGNADQVTVYDEDPVRVVASWEKQGAPYLHIVDLDGAFQGRPVSLPIIQQIARTIKIPFEVGGGMRTTDDIRAVLDAGADRVIIGTKACESPEWFQSLLQEFPGKIVASIDVKNGKVAIKGWVAESTIDPIQLAQTVQALGVPRLVYTEISRDGVMQGPDYDHVRALLDTISIPVIYAGGVTSLSDVQKFMTLGSSGLEGVIIGKALYNGSIRFCDVTPFLT